MPAFVHTGDIHLDSAFSAHLSAEGAMLRRNDVMHNMSEIIRLASDADLLLISGDLFDSPNVSANTVSFVKRKFAEIPNTHIFIAAGNHDPYTIDSVYAKTDFGSNVHIFATEPECVELPEIKTRVYGVSFPGTAPGRLGFPNADKTDGFSNIIVLHADLTSNANSVYNPITLADIKKCGADYVALGHIHKRSEPQKSENTTFAYCGIPEGRGFDECGDLGCYIGEISENVTTVGFRRTCIKRLFDIRLDISAADDMFHVYELAAREMQKIGTENDLYRITLCGRTCLSGADCSAICTQLGKFGVVTDVLDKTKPDYDPNGFIGENSLCGEFVRRLSSVSDLLKENGSANSDKAESIGSFLNRYTKDEVRLSDLDAELIDYAESIGLSALLGGD